MQLFLQSDGAPLDLFKRQIFLVAAMLERHAPRWPSSASPCNALPDPSVELVDTKETRFVAVDVAKGLIPNPIGDLKAEALQRLAKFRETHDAAAAMRLHHGKIEIGTGCVVSPHQLFELFTQIVDARSSTEHVPSHAPFSVLTTGRDSPMDALTLIGAMTKRERGELHLCLQVDGCDALAQVAHGLLAFE